jgi:hypothetical protein
VNLKTNTSKKKFMTCKPRPELGHISDHEYKRMMDGSGASYRARQKRRVTCPLCGAVMAQGYLSRNLRQVHGLSETPVVSSFHDGRCGTILFLPGELSLTKTLSPVSCSRIPRQSGQPWESPSAFHVQTSAGSYCDHGGGSPPPL